jgi:hypothetical protein
MTQPALIPESVPAELQPFVALFERLALLLSDRPPQAVQTSIWIPIEQAAEYSGLSVGLLRRLVASERLVGIRDQTIKVRKSDLEQLNPATLLDLPPARPRKRGARKK